MKVFFFLSSIIIVGRKIMKCQAFFYKSLPLLHVVVHILEFSCTVTLLYKVFKYPDFFFSDPASGSSNTTSEKTTLTEIIFGGLFFISEFLPFITFLFLIFIIPFALLVSVARICKGGCCFICLCLIRTKWLHRCMSLNCNCPCYRARPQFRFGFRLGFLFICFCLRIAVIIGCLIFSSDIILKKLGIICAISCGFLFLQFLLDIYQYCVLWHYVPDEDTLPKRTLSSKHKRYLPFHLLGHTRTKNIGNYPCKRQMHCRDRRLEHIMIFHATDYQPQPRWCEVQSVTRGGIYIGFHQTKPEYAMNIAHSDFQPSMNPPQMLGFGIYFARSLANTFGKARNQGAFICAEIRMGKVKEIKRSQLDEVRNSNTWWDEYDTVYLNHDDETRDEFCIKSSKQIVRWVIAVHDQYDRKIHDYGMYDEFDDTKCFCC